MTSLLALLLGCTGEEPEPTCPPGDACRVAGNGQLGFNGEGLPALESWLYFPSTVRFHPDGRLVIVDFNNMRIRALERDGTLVTIAGSGDHAYSTPNVDVLDSALENPVDAQFRDDGTFYIMGLHEARVLYVSADGIIAPVAGTGDPGYAGDGGPADAALISEAAGIALDGDRLFIADTENNCIRKVEGGIISTFAGSTDAGFVDGAATDARFSGPQHITVAQGALWVADANNHAIRRVELDTGEVTTVAGTGELGYAGDGGSATTAQLNTPWGLDLGSDGTLYIADSGNNVIRRVRDGVIETIAGSGVTILDPDDGPASEATFSFPSHVLAHGDDLYVADFRNGVVWELPGGATE